MYIYKGLTMLRKDESNFIGATLSWGWMTGHLANPFQFHYLVLTFILGYITMYCLQEEC